jgi:type II secretory pathway pseudopilin PulG
MACRIANGKAMLRRQSRATQGGITYLGVLFVVAWIGLAATATLKLGAIHQRRQAEDELLFVGAAWRAALRSYQEARSTPGLPAKGPQTLDELLADHRFNPPRRHVRQLYRDPITGHSRWGVLRAADGGIVGVHSLSPQVPIRMANFPADFFFFRDRHRYSDWIFVWGLTCTDAGCEMPGGTLR